MFQVLRRLAGCPHRRLSWPRRRDGKDLQTCLDCGELLESTIQFEVDSRFRPILPPRARRMRRAEMLARLEKAASTDVATPAPRP
jgi:hypothetical protein